MLVAVEALEQAEHLASGLRPQALRIIREATRSPWKRSRTVTCQGYCQLPLPNVFGFGVPTCSQLQAPIRASYGRQMDRPPLYQGTVGVQLGSASSSSASSLRCFSFSLTVGSFSSCSRLGQRPPMALALSAPKWANGCLHACYSDA